MENIEQMRKRHEREIKELEEEKSIQNTRNRYAKELRELLPEKYWGMFLYAAAIEYIKELKKEKII